MGRESWGCDIWAAYGPLPAGIFISLYLSSESFGTSRCLDVALIGRWLVEQDRERLSVYHKRASFGMHESRGIRPAGNDACTAKICDMLSNPKIALGFARTLLTHI